MGYRDLRLARLIGCVIAGPGQWIPFPTPGKWAEQIGGTLPALQITQNDQWTPRRIPSNYGVVYMRE
jgi:hypothetical protein